MDSQKPPKIYHSFKWVALLLLILLVSFLVIKKNHNNDHQAQSPVRSIPLTSQEVAQIESFFNTKFNYNKKVIQIYYWAEYCPPCKSAFQRLTKNKALLEQVKSEEFFIINKDDEQNINKAKKFYNSFNIPIKSYYNIITPLVLGPDALPSSITVDLNNKTIIKKYGSTF